MQCATCGDITDNCAECESSVDMYGKCTACDNNFVLTKDSSVRRRGHSHAAGNFLAAMVVLTYLLSSLNVMSLQCVACAKFNPRCQTCKADGTCEACAAGNYVKYGKVRPRLSCHGNRPLVARSEHDDFAIPAVCILLVQNAGLCPLR